MIRLHFIVEGQTEETFVNRLLAVHLGAYNISVDARRVETRRRSAKIYRGGLSEYRKAKQDIRLWMKEDQGEDAYFTTMFDLYALPKDFPGFVASENNILPLERITRIEQAFKNDIEHPRFIPYIQLHEFEALLFSEPEKFDWEFIDNQREIQELVKIASLFESPELINDDPSTAPSKRIIKLLPEYAGRKASAGPLIAEKIGVLSMRAKCVHFDAWLRLLELLGST